MKSLLGKLKTLEDKKKLLAVFGILATVLITLSATYAFFSYAKQGLTENSIESGAIKFIYNESSRVGNGISITDAMPIPDENGKVQDKYFDFSVTGTSGTAKIAYEITARKTDSSDNIDDSVKVYLTKVDGNNETQKVLSIYDDLDQSTNALAANHTEKTLYTGSIPAGSTNYTENFRLRMWLNNDINDGNVLEYTQIETGSCSDSTYTNETDCVVAKKDWTRVATPMVDKEFTVKVNVYANGQAATAQEIADANSVGINGVAVNGINATLNEDETKNYDYYVEVAKDSQEIEFSIDEKVDGQTISIESITENEANTIKGMSNTIKLPVSIGDNYYKLIVHSSNKLNEDIYIIKVSCNVKVTFNADGGTVSESTRIVVPGNKIGELPIATHSDSTMDFVGWYTDQTYATQVTKDYVVNDNMTLYAKFGLKKLTLIGKVTTVSTGGNNASISVFGNTYKYTSVGGCQGCSQGYGNGIDIQNVINLSYGTIVAYNWGIRGLTDDVYYSTSNDLTDMSNWTKLDTLTWKYDKTVNYYIAGYSY